MRSFTKTVPTVVPSLFQSSKPIVPSSAEKYKVPFTLVKLSGKDEVVKLGCIFFTKKGA